MEVVTETLRLGFSPEGAAPVRWIACEPSCDSEAGRPVRSVVFGDLSQTPQAGLVLSGAAGTMADLGRLSYSLHAEETDRARVLRFVSEPLPNGMRVEKRFEIAKRGYRVDLTVRLLGEPASALAGDASLELTLRSGEGMSPPPSSGFAAVLERIKAVYTTPGGVERLEPGDGERRSADLEAQQWAGVRNRFWALLARPSTPGTVRLPPLDAENGQSIVLRSEPLPLHDLTVRYSFYSGPVEYDALRERELTPLLFAGLWFWLRALSFGLLFLLSRIDTLVGNPGVAILLLALTVKILLYPLTRIADRWQCQVNREQSLLQPHLDAIKARYKGEEQTREIIELYRQHGIHPLHTLKSLFGFLIQIPVFIGVFDMLAENFALQGVSFLWIDDLALPDRLAALPFSVPFFGGHLNLLPFLMTGIALLAAVFFDAPTLTPELQKRQRRNLYLMAALFFVLFYTFPAGMVLYWTSTNLVQFAKDRLTRVVRGRREGPPNPPRKAEAAPTGREAVS